MRGNDSLEDEARRIYHVAELWPGDRLELAFGDRWIPAAYDADSGVVVFEVDRRSFGIATIDQAVGWGLRAVLH